MKLKKIIYIIGLINLSSSTSFSNSTEAIHQIRMNELESLEKIEENRRLKSIGYAGTLDQYTDVKGFSDQVTFRAHPPSRIVYPNSIVQRQIVSYLGGLDGKYENPDILKQLKTIYAEAKNYFGLNEGSSISLIHGGQNKNGINQRFEDSLKSNNARPGKNALGLDFFTYRTLGDGKTNPEMRTSEKYSLVDRFNKPSLGSDEKVAEISKTSHAISQIGNKLNGSHLVLAEGGEQQLATVLEYICRHHNLKGQKALIHLAIGYEPTDKGANDGVRAASILAKHLALHPKLIPLLELQGIKFMAIDGKSGSHYSDIRTYFKSEGWKSQLEKFRAAEAAFNTEDFIEKKFRVTELQGDIAYSEKDRPRLQGRLDRLISEVKYIEKMGNSEKYLGTITEGFDKVGSTTMIWDNHLRNTIAFSAKHGELDTRYTKAEKVDLKEVVRETLKGVR